MNSTQEMLKGVRSLMIAEVISRMTYDRRKTQPPSLRLCNEETDSSTSWVRDTTCLDWNWGAGGGGAQHEHLCSS